MLARASSCCGSRLYGPWEGLFGLCTDFEQVYERVVKMMSAAEDRYVKMYPDEDEIPEDWLSVEEVDGVLAAMGGDKDGMGGLMEAFGAIYRTCMDG